MSDEGDEAITIIAFIGSVFSPYYAWARRRRDGDPLNHCALNVALYRPNGNRWALTERTRHDLARDRRNLVIGPSSVSWLDGEIVLLVDEVTAPIPSRIKGRIRVCHDAVPGPPTTLDARGHHTWRPIAPSARVEVTLDSPKLRWTGSGYLDCNFGTEPLERAFKHWDWARAHVGGSTIVLYNAERRDGSAISLARRYEKSGGYKDIAVPPPARLPSTFWRVERPTRCDAGAMPRLIKTLEDAPFYSRSLIETSIGGERVTAIHESLDLDRFAHPIVHAMLPFRMPRRRYNQTPAA